MEDLQRAARRAAARRLVRTAGAMNVVTGPLAAWVALTALPDTALRYPVAALGALLLLVGVWHLAAPSRLGVYADATITVLAGLGCVAAMLTPGGPPVRGALVGAGWLTAAALLGLGIGAFQTARRIGPALGERVAPDLHRALRRSVMRLLIADPRTEADVVEVRAPGSPRLSWKVRLMADRALASVYQSTDILVVPRTEMGIEVRGKCRFGGGLRVTVHAGGRDLEGAMTPEQAERLQGWIARS